MLRFLRRKWHAPEESRVTRWASRSRLEVECLEDRFAPAIITVTSAADVAIGTTHTGVTLRDAIHAANTDTSVNGSVAGSGADRIVFAASLAGANIFLTINSSTADGPSAFEITSDITIDGDALGASGRVTASARRHFLVANANAALRLEDITLTSGASIGAADGGSILLTQGLVETNTVTFTVCLARSGGGIYQNGGTLRLANTTFTSNIATNLHGGGYAFVGGSFEFVNTPVFRGNIAAGDGGGFYVANASGSFPYSFDASSGNVATNGGLFSLNNSSATFTGTRVNSNTATNGGGVHFKNSIITLDGVNIRENTASTSGGGIAVDGGTVTLQNGSQVASNTATNRGGGIQLISGTVIVDASTVSSNRASTGGGGGANIGDGEFRVQNGSVFSKNAAAHGGALALTSPFSVLTVSDSTIGGAGNGNMASTSGGAVSQGIGSSSFVNSTILGNKADLDAGGLLITTGVSFVIRSVLQGNLADADANFTGNGGAVYVVGGGLNILDSLVGGAGIGDANSAYSGGALGQAAGNLNVRGSTLANNTATGYGGGLFLQGGTTLVTNSTISTNQGAGGGAAVLGGSLRFTNSTIAANFYGGVLRLGGTVTSANSIFSGNATFDVQGEITSRGNNLFENPSGLTGTAGSDLLSRAAMLGPLGDNGGGKLTHALLTGSEALNSGNNLEAIDPAASNAFLLTDERGAGFNRFFGGLVDIGAFELVDLVAPSLTVTPSGTYTNENNALFTFQFSEPVRNFTAADVNVSNGTKGDFTAVDADTYTLVVAALADGLVTASVPANAANDFVGNFSTAASTTITFDRAGPEVTIGAPTPAATVGGPVSFTLTYSDPNFLDSSALTASLITLIKTGTADGTLSVAAGAGTVRIVTITGITGNGTLGIALAAESAVDRAGNKAVGAGPSATVLVDDIAPTVTLSDPSIPSTSVGPVTFTVTYADANFGASTLASANVVLNTTGTANATIGVSGSGLTRTVTLSGITGDGTLGISLAAGTAADLSGNLAPAAGPSATFLVDNTAPTLAITPDAVRTNAAPILFTFTFSENVQGFTAGDVVVTNGTKGTFTTVSDSTYTLEVMPTADGTVTTTVAAGAAVDAVNQASVAAVASVISDRTGPTVTVSGPSAASTIAGPISYTVTYADDAFDASTLTAAEVTLVRTGTANATVVVSGSGAVRTVTLVDVYGNGTIRIALKAGTASDVAGNLAAATPPSAAFSVAGNRVLRLNQTALPAYILPGSVRVQIFAFANVGNQISPNAVLRFTLPANATFLRTRSDPRWVSVGGGRFELRLGKLGIGASGRVAFAMTFSPATPPGAAAIFALGLGDDLTPGRNAIASILRTIVVNPNRLRWAR